MQKVDLETLKIGFPAISKNIGRYLAEGGAYCLEANDHKSGVIMQIMSDSMEDVVIIWKDKIDAQVKRAWNDSLEATEYGATAIAILLIKKFTDYTIIERSFRGTGFDYWLGTGEYDENLLPFEQRKAQLEVSGIWKESEHNKIDVRVRLKQRQVNRSNFKKFPVFVIVVEFGTPKAKMVKQ